MTAPFSHKAMRAQLRSGKIGSATQCGALCWRLKGSKLQVLLITSRESGRWVVPKGWPMADRTLAEAALQEAWEEAGVDGKLRDKSVGVFTYRKKMRDGAVPCTVAVFPVKVKTLAKEFPEKGQRRRKWVSRKKAAQMVREPGLARLIRNFDPRKAR